MSIYTTEQFTFDSVSGELSNGYHTVRLEPNIATLLVFLLNNQNRVISRNELVEHVWSGRVVSDDAINRSVSILRQALNPEQKSAFIKTIPKRGYTASFPHLIDERVPKQPDVAIEMSRIRVWLRRSIVSLSGIVLVVLFSLHSKLETHVVPQTQKAPIIAVLPFTASGTENNHGFVGEGIGESIISQLSKIGDIKVIAKTSSFAVNHRQSTIAEIASILGADYVLEGNYQKQQSNILVNAQLIDSRNQTAVWSTSLNRPHHEVFVLQQEIVNQVLEAVAGNILNHSITAYQPKFPAYQQVMLGLHELEKQTIDGAKLAKQHFETALSLDPKYPLAYVYLARSLEHLKQYDLFLQQDVQLSEFKSEELLEQALSLQPLLSEALALKGHIMLTQGRLEYAEDYLLRAIKMNPSDTHAMADLARVQMSKGKVEEAILSARHALRLNPESRNQRHLLAMILWQSGRAEAAIVELERDIKPGSDSVTHLGLLARWAAQMGDPMKAMEYAYTLWQNRGSNPTNHWVMCLTYIHLWDESAALSCIDDLLTDYPNYYEAKMWKALVMGEREKAYQLTNEQIQNKPHVTYFKLQLADDLVTYKQDWNAAISLLTDTFPELNRDAPYITDRNIWAARLLGYALINTEQLDAGTQILEQALSHVEKSRRMLAGGYTSGVDDVLILAALGRLDEATSQLSTAIDNDWFFYSYGILKYTGLTELENSSEYQRLKGKLEIKMRHLHPEIHARFQTPYNAVVGDLP